ncbi:hypothetical protein [Streptomyces fradiae]|uniref:hypothetical protein n=1 Tax=Streptomyces fradiae TaxID=1906 RepID=UPI002943EFB5|nr:hypothetical protein [Streptomyces fradiae]WOI63445.1 hypothetical protein RYQ63_28215 [Streptomyces fradiae]
MNHFDRYLIDRARQVLAEDVDLSDDRAAARRIGQLEAVLAGLLEVVDATKAGPADE